MADPYPHISVLIDRFRREELFLVKEKAHE